MTRYPRRQFVLSVLAACGTPLFTHTAAVGTRQLRPADAAAARAGRTAVAYFGTTQSDAARAVGEAYLQSIQAESSPAAILGLVGSTLDIIAGARTQRAATAALVSAVRADFRDGLVIHLHGWVLSRTEVELCAMTLLPPA